MLQIDPKAQIAVLQKAIEMLQLSSQDLTGNKAYAIGLLEGMMFVLETQVVPENTSKLE